MYQKSIMVLNLCNYFYFLVYEWYRISIGSSIKNLFEFNQYVYLYYIKSFNSRYVKVKDYNLFFFLYVFQIWEFLFLMVYIMKKLFDMCYDVKFNYLD